MRNTLLATWVWLAIAGCGAEPEGGPDADPQREAKADAQKLVAAMVPEAERLLAEGRFAPFAKVMLADGEIAAVDSDASQPDQRLTALREALRKKAAAGEARATALAYSDTAALGESGRLADAVAVEIDHRDQYSVALLFPYNLGEGVVRWRAPQARPGAGEVFVKRP